MSRTTSSTVKTRTTPPSLSHFVILNPTLRPAASTAPPNTTTPSQSNADGPTPPPAEDQADHEPTPPVAASAAPEERDKDLEDDLREAAQILFYTSRSSSSVSRDTMLKQTGLVKGLMGFTDMLVPPGVEGPADAPGGEVDSGTAGRTEAEPILSIRSSKGRLMVYTPEEGFYICVGITLAMSIAEDGSKEVLHNAQGLSDRVLVSGLQKGYEDFRLLHGSFASLLPATKATTSILDKFWTRFAFAYENDTISAPTNLDLSIPTHLAPTEETSLAACRALEVFMEDSEVPTGSQLESESGSPSTTDPAGVESLQCGVVTRTGPLYSTDCDPALSRYLTSLAIASAPPPVVHLDARSTLGHGSRRDTANVRDRKTSWGMSMGLGMGWVPTLPGMTPRSVTPVGREDARSIRSVASGSEVGEPGAVGARDASGKEGKGKWGFGLSSLGLGEAMGSVGTVFGLGASAHPGGTVEPTSRGTHSNMPSLSSLADGRPVGSLPTSADADSGEGATTAVSAIDDAETPHAAAAAEPIISDDIVTTTTVHRPELGDRLESSLATEIDTLHLRQPDPLVSGVADTDVDVEELQAAVEPESAIDLGWASRTVYISDGSGAVQKKRLTWVIRDEVLLYLLHPPSGRSPDDPPPRAVLSLFSKLGSILQPDEVKSAKDGGSRHKDVSSVVHVRGGSVERSGPDVDTASSASLAEIGDVLHGNQAIREVYARTPASKFIAARKVLPMVRQQGADGQRICGHEKEQAHEEVYMLVGRKDASLTDAEHAMRVYTRGRAEISA